MISISTDLSYVVVGFCTHVYRQYNTAKKGVSRRGKISLPRDSINKLTRSLVKLIYIRQGPVHPRQCDTTQYKHKYINLYICAFTSYRRKITILDWLALQNNKALPRKK